MAGRSDFDNPVIKEDIALTADKLKRLLPDLAGRRILVTGAYGMLASYIVYTLLALSDRARDAGLAPISVTALGRSRDKMEARFGELLKREDLTAVRSDALTYAEKLASEDSAATSYHYIIHAASPTDPRSYITSPETVIRLNVSATDRLLTAAVRGCSEGFLFISSGEVYGKLKKDVIDESDGGTFDAADPRNVYALSKCLGERLCRSAAEKRGLRTVIVRPSHTYGPTMDIDGDSRVFASFIGDAVRGRDIVMTSDGTATRAFTYLTDAVRGYLTALVKGEAGASYNVTNNAGIRSVRELASLIASETERQGGPAVRAVFAEPESTYIENANRSASIRSTARLEALGWEALMSPEEGFARTLRSFLA